MAAAFFFWTSLILSLGDLFKWKMDVKLRIHALWIKKNSIEKVNHDEIHIDNAHICDPNMYAIQIHILMLYESRQY